MKIGSIIDNMRDFIDGFVTRKLRIGEPWSDRLISIVFALVIVSISFVLYFSGKHVVSLITNRFDRVPINQEIFLASIDLFKKGDYKGSIKKSEQLIEAFPSSDYVDQALFNIGKAHHNREKYDDARAAYNKFLEKYPKSEHKDAVQRQIKKLLLNEAQVLFTDKKYDQAYEAFNKLLTDEELKGYQDLEAKAMEDTIRCLLWLENDDAIKLCGDLIEKFPGTSEAAFALLTIGIYQYYNKDYEQSLLAFRKYLDQFSEDDKAVFGILLSLSKLNRYDEVQDYVKEEVSKQFTRKAILESYARGMKQVSYSSREVLWARAKVYEQARTEFENIVKELESIEFDVLDFKEDVASRLVQLYFDEGQDYYERGSYEDSRETCGQLLKRFPNSDLKGKARRLIAQSYLDEEKYNQAFINFDTLTSAEFDGSPQLQAEAMYKAAYSLKSLSIDDENRSNYEILSEALSDEALARYTEFLTRFSDSKYVSDAYFDYGKIYAAQRKYKFALNRYEDALRNTDNPKRRAEILLDIGRTYQGLSSDNKAIEALKEAAKAAEQAIEADIENAKLARARAMYLIVHVHIQREEWVVVRNIYNDFIEEYGEAGYEVTTSEFGEPIKTDFMAICAYWIGEAYHEMKDFGKALEWYEKIVKEKGFQTDDSVPEILKEKDFRTDALAPQSLYRSLLVRNKLEGAEKLEGIANKYINDMRDDNPFLSAKARFNFAKIKREVFQDYKGAAKEFAKLAAYRGSDLRLNLIKLQGKYYEGLCYEQSASSEEAEAAYKKIIMLFNLNFQRLIDTPNIKPSNISKKVFDYCIQIALEYAEKACAEIKDTEYTNKACAEIKQARQKLESKDKTTQKSDASNNSNSSEASQTKGQLTPEQIAQKGSGSTVFITMEGTREYESGQVIDGGYIDDETGEIVDAALGTGSGFFVKPNQIATNYHVIAPKYRRSRYEPDVVFWQPLRGTARIVGTDREYAIIGYIAIDPDRDLAILKVRDLGVKPLSRGDSAAINQGEAVYPIGNPLGLANVVSEGQISSVQWVKSIREFMNNKSKLVKDFRQNNTPHKLFMMTAPISGGNSGGPVLDSKGRVIGVSVGYRKGGQNLNYAVPVNYLKVLLERVGTPKPLSDLEIIY